MKRTKGFTLVEVFIALAILSVLAAIVIPALMGYVQSSRNNVADTNLAHLRTALEAYYLENNTYVAGSYTNGVDSGLTGPLGWRPEGDDDKFTYTVAACPGGTIANCYKITITGLSVTRNHTFAFTP